MPFATTGARPLLNYIGLEAPVAQGEAEMGHKKFKRILVIGTPEWMISFGDLMSCLLVFFVLLLTFSSNKPDQLMDMMGDYVMPGGSEDSQDLGDISGAAGAVKRIAVEPEEEAPMKLANLIVSQKFHDFKERLFKMGFKHDITYTQTEDGFFVETNESNVLDPKGAILPEAALLLQAMANAAISVKKELRVLLVDGAGPSEEVPLSSAIRSQESAMTVFDYLQSKYQMKDCKMSCGTSFSDAKVNKFRLLVADSLEGRAFSLNDISKPKS